MPQPFLGQGRARWRRRLVDAVLLPFALLLVLGEAMLRSGSRLLRRWAPIRRLEARLARLPPWAILPLFLIPEAMSHVGGFYAAFLFAHKQYAAATAVVVLIKGVGVIIALWIYQACRPALMTIGWFAWLHGKVEASRRWATSIVGPSWRRVRAGVARLLRGNHGAVSSGRRFAALRSRLATRFARDPTNP